MKATHPSNNKYGAFIYQDKNVAGFMEIQRVTKGCALIIARVVVDDSPYSIVITTWQKEKTYRSLRSEYESQANQLRVNVSLMSALVSHIAVKIEINGLEQFNNLSGSAA
jgi:hypothetical protein